MRPQQWPPSRDSEELWEEPDKITTLHSMVEKQSASTGIHDLPDGGFQPGKGVGEYDGFSGSNVLPR